MLLGSTLDVEDGCSGLLCVLRLLVGVEDADGAVAWLEDVLGDGLLLLLLGLLVEVLDGGLLLLVG